MNNENIGKEDIMNMMTIKEAELHVEKSFLARREFEYDVEKAQYLIKPKEYFEEKGLKNAEQRKAHIFLELKELKELIVDIKEEIAASENELKAIYRLYDHIKDGGNEPNIRILKEGEDFSLKFDCDCDCNEEEDLCG